HIFIGVGALCAWRTGSKKCAMRCELKSCTIASLSGSITASAREALGSARQLLLTSLKEMPACCNLFLTTCSLPGRSRKNRSGCSKREVQNASISIPALSSCCQGNSSCVEKEMPAAVNTGILSCTASAALSFHAGLRCCNNSLGSCEQRNRPASTPSSVESPCSAFPVLKYA